jgi:hypothetical protein
MTPRPSQQPEFTLDEANALMNITMHRFREGLDGKIEKPAWIRYQTGFNNKFGWAPSLERMMVLDLMFQIDLVYWFQMGGDALHPWTKYKRNVLCAQNGIPPHSLAEGP